MIKIKYFCDCCGKEVEKSDLSRIETTFGCSDGIVAKDICFNCWKIYTTQVSKIAKEMFKR